jgi:hypothetical protein
MGGGIQAAFNFAVSHAMTTIKADCRERLTAEDLQFVANSVSNQVCGSPGLLELLQDSTARDAALESDRLLQALLDAPEPLRVSPQLYFYVLVRRTLGKFDRFIADYIASVLAAFLQSRRWRTLPGHPECAADFVSDMLALLSAASSEHEFLIRAHVGNYSLFMTGIFPEHLRHRTALRGAPGLSFYEEVGSTNYRLAADHQIARRHELTDVYRTIADRFTEVRHGLNRLSDRLICIDFGGGGVR